MRGSAGSGSPLHSFISVRPVPGECCLQRKCMKYQPVDGNITVETLYHRTSEDEVDDTVQVHERKRRSSRVASHTVYTESVKWVAFHPPTKKETQRHPLDRKEGCPKACRCPVKPTCAPGSPLVMDTCGCGCKLCAVDRLSPCDGFRPCDASQNLTCDYSRGQKKNLGMCNVIREYRSCFNKGNEVVHGESFYHGCAARCDCDDGKLKCESFCRKYDPPLIDGCSKLRLKKEQCCEHWKCTERTATDTKSSQDSLIVLKSIKKGRSPSKTQVNATRQSCFVDGKEILHGQKFKDGCRHFCICSNGSGLCLPLCLPTEPEPVAGCVEMQLEAVPGLCCKKWKCMKYKSVDTKVSPEDLRELEANLSLNAPVVIRKHRSCFSDGSEIRHRQEFQLGCVGRCECKDGAVMCVSLCPPSFPAPVPGCIDMDKVAGKKQILHWDSNILCSIPTHM
uniref:VWFC domain-containing protein n=1 Tax=Leptobrachium leishanense TaxID=445787 RepID=A0A8C5QTW3_9ANUR